MLCCRGRPCFFLGLLPHAGRVLLEGRYPGLSAHEVDQRGGQAPFHLHRHAHDERASGQEPPGFMLVVEPGVESILYACLHLPTTWEVLLTSVFFPRLYFLRRRAPHVPADRPGVHPDPPALPAYELPAAQGVPLRAHLHPKTTQPDAQQRHEHHDDGAAADG